MRHIYDLCICVCVYDCSNNVSRLMTCLFVCERVRATRHSRYATIRAPHLSRNDTAPVGHAFTLTMYRHLAIIDDRI